MKKAWIIIISLIVLVVITNTDIVAKLSGQSAAYEQTSEMEADQEAEEEKPGLFDRLLGAITDFLFLKDEPEELETVVVEDDSEEVEKKAVAQPQKEKPKHEETSETQEEESEEAEEPEEAEEEQEEYVEELIGTTAVSGNYTGAPAHNVQLACDLNNSIVIMPGEVYSAFDYLGDGGEDMGFEAAAGLLSDGTVEDMYGSGICTVTTAIYQAGRDAGLTILEVSDHVGAESSYAAAGDQAMFNYPTNDLKMRNDFDYPVTLYMGYYDAVIYAEWYSQKSE